MGEHRRHNTIAGVSSQQEFVPGGARMTDTERRRRRRGARSAERMRLSSSDTAMECGRRASNKAAERKRKSMSDYLDFKSREGEECKTIEDSGVRIPVDIKEADINSLNSAETKEVKPVETSGGTEPRRRKLSAEKIIDLIQRKANTITSSWKMTSSKTRGSSSPSESPGNSNSSFQQSGVQGDRRKLSLPLKKLTTIPSVEYQSDSEDAEKENNLTDKESVAGESPNQNISGGGKGILKKVSNVELPNLELIHNNLAKEDLSTLINNNSPSRIVKFDMPSFDSQLSEDVQNTEDDLSCEQQDKVSSICDISEEMRSLLEKLQSFEMSASGDHEVLQQFTLERLKLERKKWSEILRKSLSNVVRIQNTISNAFDQTTPGSEAACHLIHLDCRDQAAQTEEAPHTPPDFKDKETQTDLCESNQNSTLKDESDEASNVGQSQSNTKLNSCPNIYLMSSCGENLPEASTTANLDEQLNFDINQLKYCMETDIVDDFVLV